MESREDRTIFVRKIDCSRIGKLMQITLKIHRMLCLSGPTPNCGVSPSLNTQSCIKGLLVVRDFCFWAVWAARPVNKKSLGPIMSNFWENFFFWICYKGQKISGKNMLSWILVVFPQAPFRWDSNPGLPDGRPRCKPHNHTDLLCPGFFQKTNAGAILCSVNCPSVRF